MADNWDDSDDDWDASDDELDARFKNLSTTKEKEKIPKFDDEEEDLAVKDKEDKKRAMQAYAGKRSALAEKRAAEKDRLEEEEVARKAMEMEAEMEANLSPDELKRLKQRQVEEADAALTDDLFGTVDRRGLAPKQEAGNEIVLKDLKDHLKHARKVARVLNGNKRVHMATTYVKELIQQIKDLVDDASISEIIKTCNVIKNEKVQKAKRKVKGQAQKSAKRDKAAEAKARQLQVDLYGDNDQYDEYDQYGENYEDAFF